MSETMSDAGRIERLLERMVAELAAEPETIGVLLHGSAVNGSLDRDSDLDLLCVLGDADWTSTEVRRVDGQKVEIRRSPLAALRRELHQPQRVNNNFMLTTLCEARVLLARGSELEALIAEARRMWDDGPPPANELEIYNSRQFLRNRLKDIRRAVVSGRDAEARVLADVLFHRSLYAYCKFHRRWGQKFLHLLAVLRREDPELGAAIDAFLAAEKSAAMLAALERLVDRVIEPVGWGEVCASTGRRPLKGAHPGAPSVRRRPPEDPRRRGTDDDDR